MGKGVVVLIVVIVILLVGGVGGFVGYSSWASPDLISSNTELVTGCTDSDGDDIYTKGYTAWDDEDGDGQTTSIDFCDYYHEKTDNRVGILREYYCDGARLETIRTTCGGGYVCRDAACVKGDKDLPICRDSDGGKNIEKRGEVVGYGGSGKDVCWTFFDSIESGATTSECEGDNCSVYEYFCDGDSKDSEIIKCNNGCRNGACL